MNIACWSGPRNLSTAMMYSFGARADCAVWDEPFYAAYLAQTGLNHPMREEILDAGETDPTVVAKRCTLPPSGGEPYFYQKHMTHHMLDHYDQTWFDEVVHVFLIRHPARVLASYSQKRENPTLEDIGFAQQSQIYDAVLSRGLNAVIIDSYDIRQQPETMLSKLCDAIGIPFDPAMLAWPQGGHPDDGVWAAHWYNAVHSSTGFAGPEKDLPVLSDDLQTVCEAALPHYDRMKSLAISCPSEDELVDVKLR